MHRWGWLVIFFAIACATPGAHRVKSLNHSLADIQKAVGRYLPKGIADISSNKRVFTSKYFRPSKHYETEVGYKYRSYVKVWILGDRRPYDLDIVAYVERSGQRWGEFKKGKGKSSRGSYEKDGVDHWLAEKLAQQIQVYLVKRRKSKNLFDDFRPF